VVSRVIHVTHVGHHNAELTAKIEAYQDRTRPPVSSEDSRIRGPCADQGFASGGCRSSPRGGGLFSQSLSLKSASATMPIPRSISTTTMAVITSLILSGQRRNHFLLEQLNARAVVGGLREVADRVLAAEIADVP